MRLPIICKSLTFAAGAIACAAQPLAAEVRNPYTVEVAVPHGDLDLTDKEDIALLKERIDAAAREACTRDTIYGSPYAKIDRDCVRMATAKALAVVEERTAKQVALLDR